MFIAVASCIPVYLLMTSYYHTPCLNYQVQGLRTFKELEQRVIPHARQHLLSTELNVYSRLQIYFSIRVNNFVCSIQISVCNHVEVL
jgi:hypothetical protein